MSYRVLLIDDNQLALESMEKTIPWAEHDLELVGCASNGIQGCQMIRSLRPDILISDIQMPEMDGLTMLEQMKNELANSRVIFITAYDKIEYAARAIRLSAFDFLMKPVKNEDLIQSLDRAVQSMDRENSKIEKQAKEQTILRRARFLSALTAGSMEDIAHAFSGFVTGIPQNYFFMIAETESHVTEPISRMEFMTFPENVEILNVVLNHQLVMLCAMTGESGHWQSTARSIAATLQENFLGLTVAVSNLYSRPEDFYVAYQECRCALLRHDINGRTARVEFAYDLEGDALKHTRIEELDQVCEKIAQHITDIDPERLWSMILKKSGGNIRIIRTTLWLLCTKVIRSKLEQHQWTEEADMIVYDHHQDHPGAGGQRLASPVSGGSQQKYVGPEPPLQSGSQRAGIYPRTHHRRTGAGRGGKEVLRIAQLSFLHHSQGDRQDLPSACDRGENDRGQADAERYPYAGGGCGLRRGI